MTPADQARQNAIPLEVKKDGLQQRQNGDWVLRLVVQCADMDARITNAPMGTRFMAALVEVGPDELPVPQAEKENKRYSPTTSPATASLETGKPKRRWEEMQPQQQAGMRCSEPAFIAFLKETRPDDWHESQDAAECVRLICGVHSRVELGTNPKARVIWTQLDFSYAAWKALEHA